MNDKEKEKIINDTFADLLSEKGFVYAGSTIWKKMEGPVCLTVTLRPEHRMYEVGVDPQFGVSFEGPASGIEYAGTNVNLLTGRIHSSYKLAGTFSFFSKARARNDLRESFSWFDKFKDTAYCLQWLRSNDYPYVKPGSPHFMQLEAALLGIEKKKNDAN